MGLFDDAIKFFSGDTYVVPADRLADAKAHVNTWVTANAGEPQRWFLPRSEFATRLTQVLEDPFRLMQGSYDWCTIAAFLFCALRRFPDRVARFATSLYDSGDGDLGDFSVSVNSQLKTFDQATYASGGMPDHPLPSNRGGEPIVYRSADWIMMASIADETSTFDFTGPLDSLGGRPPVTTSVVKTFFNKSGLYASLEEITIASGDTAASVAAKLSGQLVDVVLQGSMSFLTKGTVTEGDHAAPLAAAPEVVNGALRLRWFSFGDGLSPDVFVKVPAIRNVQQHATFTADAAPSDLHSAMRGILVATARSGA